MIISIWRLRTSRKFSGQEFKEIHTNIESLETLEAGADFSKHKVALAIESARIVQYLAFDALR